MAHLVLVTHAEFAKGIISSLKLIMGSVKNVYYVSITENESIEQVTNMIKEKINISGADKAAVIISDIAGGSTTQAALRVVAEREYTYLITGLNLGLLLETASLELDENDDGNRRRLQQIIESSKSLMYLIAHTELVTSLNSNEQDNQKSQEDKII